MAFNSQSKPPIFKLNRKLLSNIFDYLRLEDISRLAQTSRRFNNSVQYYVKNLQVFVVWGDEEEEPNLDKAEKDFKTVILKNVSPADFFEKIPFKNVKQIYLMFEDIQEEPINLINLMHLKYLKIRGANIQLSKNRLTSITHVDIDDPNSFEKQVMVSLKNYHLEFNVEEFAQLYNSTESEAIDYAFKKSLDILLDKPNLEQVSFTVTIRSMELLIFEMFVDSLTDFLTKFNKEINLGFIQLTFRYAGDYEQQENDIRRWERGWQHLMDELPYKFENFDLAVQDYLPDYIPVI